MATLTRTWKWTEYVPDIGDNREQAQPFKLKVKTSLRREELAAFEERLSAYRKLPEAEQTGEAGAAVFADLVALADGVELVVDGKAIASVREYLDFGQSLTGGALFTELEQAVAFWNTVTGNRLLFYARPFGGVVSTTSHNTGRAESQRAGHSSGSGTSP